MKQLEFTTLKLFAAVAESGSISAAADKCNLTVAAVSKRIRDLEQSSHNQLFLRHARGMTLTAAGHTLLQHAREIIFSVDRMQVELRQLAQGRVGTVRVAAAGSAVAQFLPEDLKLFADRHPNVGIDLTESTSQHVVDAVLEGRVDIGIFFGPADNPELTTYEYRSDHLCLVVPRGHALARRTHVRFADTLEYEFIVLGRSSSIVHLLMIESAGRLRTRIHVQSSDALCRMVGAGLGVGVCPREAARNYRRAGDIKVIELDEPWARRQLLLGVRASASEEGLAGPARLFLAHCREAARGDGQGG
ncbi:LysR family transcriptional regulator [Verticiella sediminum]|uniref:LysR family transcriptional regulator n=1 Tax=Verticiella sediminum TaxID=1247510 RepID=A0A556ANK5_9BURK|nr:LysR substrate-binding domain-containing protein [Verticiella sediminum]TSH94470.1 LysR family transcriptional regulator [Verticiella sediminum]